MRVSTLSYEMILALTIHPTKALSRYVTEICALVAATLSAPAQSERYLLFRIDHVTQLDSIEFFRYNSVEVDERQSHPTHQI